MMAVQPSDKAYPLRLFLLMSLMTLLTFLVSCNSGDDESDAPAPPPAENPQTTLSITPVSPEITTENTVHLSVVGGQGPYRFELLLGTGTVSASGLFTPQDPGEAVIRVTDQTQNEQQISIRVWPQLNLFSSQTYHPISSHVQLTASGGVPPLTFSESSGQGQINSSGLFTAPPQAGPLVVQVKDGFGNFRDINFVIYEPLRISAASSQVFFGERSPLSITGGVAPHQTSIARGEGKIDPVTGEFIAPSLAGETEILTRDSLGNEAVLRFQTAPPLRISPNEIRLKSGEEFTFQAADGFPPYTFSVESGRGQIDANRGTFIAEPFVGEIRIRVTDASQRWAEAKVHMSDLQQIISGGSSSCAIYSSGQIKCWGANASGQLGYGNTINYGAAPNQMGAQLPFVSLGSGRSARDVALGQSHACGLLDNHQIKCWGSNFYGQLGLGSTISFGARPDSMGDGLPFVNLGTGIKVKSVYTGHFYSCAVLENSQIKCWGQNNFGQLGLGSTVNLGSASGQMGDSLPPIDLGTSGQPMSLALGYFHACALFDNGGVKCWGRSNFGQLGYGNTTTIGDGPGEMGDNLPFVNLGTGRKATALVAGIYHTCALLDQGEVKCWGKSTEGQLGIGSTVHQGTRSGQMGDRLPAVDFGNGLKATSLTANYDSTCALLENSTVKCWGLNSTGELGLEDTINRGVSPVQLGSNWPVTQIGLTFKPSQLTAGRNFFCALSLTGQVKCWGNARFGALGNASSTAHLGDSRGEMGSSLPVLDL